MALFPEQAFAFTRPQDLASQQLELVYRSGRQDSGIASNETNTGTVYSVPNDRSLVIYAWAWLGSNAAVGGAAMVPQMASLSLGGVGSPLAIMPISVAIYPLQTTLWAAGNKWVLGVQACQIWVPPGATVSMQYYNLTPPSDVIQSYWSLAGFSIPRGGITRG